MGVDPSVAIPAAVKSVGLEIDDIDLLEINEVKPKIINFFYYCVSRQNRHM